MVDISGYSMSIRDPEDKPLFEDASKSAMAGALRAAYIMLWLSCAESLKRRFREAQKRDGTAGKIVGDIEQKERNQKSVDKFLLDKAKEYGFIQEPAYTILLHIYEMRCVYGHPYDQAPTSEQVTHAAAVVVEHVLSHPVKLRHGFGKVLLNSLLQKKNFLDDQASVVEGFVTEILPKIDEKIHSWLLDSYWIELEKIANDPSLTIFFRRGIFFTRAFVAAASGVFTADDWHDKASAYPKTLIRALNKKELSDLLGERAQYTLVGEALDEASDRSSVLQFLEGLMKKKALSERQQSRFLEHLDTMQLAKLRSAKLETATCLKLLIKGMKSHDWYKQKPVVEVVVGNGSEQVGALDVADQVSLGRNILQVADGNERTAMRFLESLTDVSGAWPQAFIQGIVLECFVNEDGKVRLKCDRLKTVLQIVDKLDQRPRESIVAKVRSAIAVGTPKGGWLYRKEFTKVCEQIGVHDWAAPLKQALVAMEEELVTSRADVEDD